MLPELGHFALVLALLLAGLQAFFGIVGPALARDRWTAAASSAVAGQFVMIATAVGILVYAFVTYDFSVLYVAENSNSALPLMYRIAALWGAHEGSLLLWIFLLAVWTLAVAIASRNLPERFAARVLGVLGVLSFGFILFTLATSDPFRRLIPAAADGHDLNPLLQDPGLAIHPPVLYTGLCGPCGGLLLRLRRDARGPHGSGLGALDTTLDDRGVGLPDLRHHAWQLVVVLHAGVGRLLGVGSGRECLLHAVAGGHRAHPFPRRDRKTRPVQELDAAASDPGILVESDGNLPGALRRAGVGALLCGRPLARAFHSGVPGTGDRRSADAVCVAGAAAQIQCRLRSAVARELSAVQQYPAGGRCGDRARRHPRAADRRHVRAAHLVGGTAVLSPDLPLSSHSAAAAACRSASTPTGSAVGSRPRCARCW